MDVLMRINVRIAHQNRLFSTTAPVVLLRTHCANLNALGLVGRRLLGSGEIAVPLKRLKEEYLQQDGVRFLMEDEAGNTVACRVSHEALRNHADRMHFSGTDGAVFETYRELIEEVASEAHDAEGPFDAHGRVLVTSEAIARVTRSA
jgi:Protein of unknown function (DUF1488)